MPNAFGNTSALRHGANSQVIVRKTATAQKRRVLRQLGLRQSDLDALALGLLDNYARAQSKIELYDAWAHEHGYLTVDGKSPPWVREYFAALNTARLALRALHRGAQTRRGLDAPRHC